MPTEAPGPRIIATDLDGTLLRSDLTISDYTRRVLRELEERAVHVVFVTARPPRWMAPLADAVSGHGRAICLNGACIFDFATGTTSDVYGFEPPVLGSIVADLRAELPGIAFAVERPSGPVFDEHFVSEHPRDPGALVAEIESLTDDVVGKLLAVHSGIPDDEFFAHITRIVGQRAILAYSGASGLAEMTAPGVTKAAALARWAASHGVDASQVWAFGDMPNDIPMLTWAGRGIAVANAHPDARAVADAVTTSNDEDGVARALAELLLQV